MPIVENERSMSTEIAAPTLELKRDKLQALRDKFEGTPLETLSDDYLLNVELDDDCIELLTLILDPHNNINPDKIPIHPKHIVQLIKSRPYADFYGCGVSMYFITGSRICEMENWEESNVEHFRIRWQPGKNQDGKPMRNEYMGKTLWEELQEMRRRNRQALGKLFGVNGETFTRYFNKFVRPNLPPVWRLPSPYSKKGKIRTTYIYQVKGLRKTFVTLRWWKYVQDGHSEEMAADMVADDMRHSRKETTIKHYLCNAKFIEATKYYLMLPYEILKGERQEKVYSYEVQYGPG